MRRPTQIVLLWTVGAAIIFSGFQNCSQVGFAVDPSVLEADRATFNVGSGVEIDRAQVIRHLPPIKTANRS